MATSDAQYRCSFCDKPRQAVKRLIAGPRGVFICNECVAIANESLREESASSPETS